MGKMTIQDLASVLVERWHLGKKEASLFVNEMFFVIQKSLDDDKIVKVKGLGTFKIIDVEDRESVDVNTGDRVLIEGHGKITFTPDALMKELVNKPFSQFETVVLNEGVDFNDADNAVQSEEPIALDDMEDSSVPLVEFVTEDEEPLKISETKEPEIPVMPLKSEEPEVAPEQPKVEETVQEESASEPILEETPNEEVHEDTIEDATEDVVEDATEDVAEDTTEDATGEATGEADEPAEEGTGEEGSAFKKYIKWIGIALLTLAIGILIGYLMGNRSNKPHEIVAEPIENDTVKVLPKDSDSIRVEAPAPEVKVETPEVKKETPEVKVETPEVKEETPEDRPLDKWEAMDARVRTGAYRIVGTDQVVKARAGDNLTRICNRTIGKGMECYLEVYNDISSKTALTAGQEIKIPKLELKKKKKKIEQ